MFKFRTGPMTYKVYRFEPHHKWSIMRYEPQGGEVYGRYESYEDAVQVRNMLNAALR